MSSYCELLIVQGEPFLARTLVDLLARCLARAELAATPRQAIARMHDRDFAGVIVDAASTSVDVPSFAQQLRANDLDLPIFVIAPKLTAEPAQRPFGLEACTVCALRPGWPLELQRWVLGVSGRSLRRGQPSRADAQGHALGNETPGALIRELASARR